MDPVLMEKIGVETEPLAPPHPAGLPDIEEADPAAIPPDEDDDQGTP